MATTAAAIKKKLGTSTRDWDQKCQALCWNIANWFGHAPVAYGSANQAYHASHIVSKNPALAPAGSWHYWDIGQYGHVAFGLGGSRVLMASSHIDSAWATHAGTTTVGRYNARTGARYLGWSNTNGANDAAVKAPTKTQTRDQLNVKKIAKFLNKQDLGRKTTAADDGVRGRVYWLLVQKYAKYHLGYTGDVDGDPGPMSKAAEKKILKKA